MFIALNKKNKLLIISLNNAFSFYLYLKMIIYYLFMLFIITYEKGNVIFILMKTLLIIKQINKQVKMRKARKGETYFYLPYMLHTIR